MQPNKCDPESFSLIAQERMSSKKRAMEETLSVRTSPKTGAQSSPETREPKKPPPQDSHRELEDAQAQRRASLEDVGRLERERHSAETARQAAVEEEASDAEQETEPVGGLSSWLVVATQSRTLSACPSSRALVRVPDHPTDHPDLDDEADLDAWLRAAYSRKRVLEAQRYHDYDMVALGVRLEESSAAKSQALREHHAALQLERRRGEELSAELASAERALREARGELDELRQGKAASEAAAQESARRLEVLKIEKLNVEAARQSSERAKQVAETRLIGCRELITRLGKQLCKSMEEQSRQQARLDGFQQLSAEARTALARMARGP